MLRLIVNGLALSNLGAESARTRNFPQYLLNGSKYCEEILQVYFYIIEDYLEYFEVFFCLHTLP